jgi:DNA-binding response OmpR family regulator
VLVVDDDTLVAEMVAIALRRAGYSVTTADCGEAARDVLAREAFDVLVSDLRMGDGMDGWELSAWVKEHWPATRIVLLTAEASTIEPASARERGVGAVLGKPMRLVDLLAAVGAASTGLT